MVGLFALLAVGIAHNVEHHLKAAGFNDPSSESERATRTLDGALGYDPNPGITLVVRAPDGGRLNLQSPAFRRQVNLLSARVERVPNVGRVVDPLRDRREGAELIARDEHSLVISAHLSTAELEDSGGIAAEGVQAALDASPLRVSMGGFAASFNEVNDQTRTDLTKAELIAFPVLALLLLIVFRGLVAAGIPLLIGGISIVGTLLMLRVMSVFVDTSLFALNIATGLSLGLAVDYALLMISRYREEIASGGATREAHRRTVETAGRTVVFSGFTVAAAIAALAFFPQRFLYSIAGAGAAVGVLSAVIALLVVPSLLSLLGTRIDALSIRRGPAVSDESDGWYRLARGVMRHPIGVALASAGLLLLAASPLLGTELTGPSAQAVPPGLPSYEANAYLESHYPEDVNNAVTVVVDGHAGAARLARLSRQIGMVEGIARTAPFARASRRVAFANVALGDKALRRLPNMRSNRSERCRRRAPRRSSSQAQRPASST
ncbi:MAG: MMPL family transporter [Solirubrobacterales bacterium]